MNRQLAHILHDKDSACKPGAKANSKDENGSPDNSKACLSQTTIDENLLSTPTPTSFGKTISSNPPPLRSPSDTLVKQDYTTATQHSNLVEFDGTSPPLLPELDIDDRSSGPMKLFPRQGINKRARLFCYSE
eukprot:CAMPEP_0196805720 /NCGR_PEP_ID=MMETSP1362-20130617/5538_1 /TAXON_ID=163516 /ORGANISM="Leptocylindrus danicus, Strain CCMP1856" /LENGTH=131 /DNA_ID=CAMNT_0042178817 /DNA_START=29 /DNA_END=424 /DNA_ORIENTATION=+